MQVKTAQAAQQAIAGIIEDGLEQVALDALTVVLEAHAEATGNYVGIYAGELASAVGISTADVLDKLADQAAYWHWDGRRFANYADLMHAIRKLPIPEIEEAEIVVFKRDAGMQLVAALFA